MIELSGEEWKTVRKALQVLQRAHMIVETVEGTEDYTTKLDELILKIRVAEETGD